MQYVVCNFINLCTTVTVLCGDGITQQYHNTIHNMMLKHNTGKDNLVLRKFKNHYHKPVKLWQWLLWSGQQNWSCLTLNRRLDHNFGSDVVSHKGWSAPHSPHKCLYPHPWASGQQRPGLAGQIHSMKTHALVYLQHTQYDGLCKVNHINSHQFQFTGGKSTALCTN
jgi:hypothetical protein